MEAEEDNRDPNPLQEYSRIGKFIAYIFTINSIVDAFSIVPAWCVSPVSVVGRVLRVFRIFKALRFGEMQELIIETLPKSGDIHFFPLFTIIIIAALFFGCLIFLAEGRNFTVNANFPTGKYVRFNPLTSAPTNPYEESPFTIIYSCIYWAIITVTTVGYGDMVPSTSAGRVIAGICVIVGVIVIALPVTVLVGTHFSNAYNHLLYTEKIVGSIDRTTCRHVSEKDAILALENL